MKLNNKSLLTLFVLFIAIFSISSVSAEILETNDMSDVSLYDINDEIIPIANHNIATGSNSSTIQKVVDNAAAGDTITFASGNYNFSSAINVDKTLKFIGNGAKITGLNGFKVESSDTVTADGTSFTNFYFNGNGVYQGRFIEAYGISNFNVTNCTVKGPINTGVHIQSCTNVLIANCKFLDGGANATTITTAGKGEKGTKSIGIMGGNKVTIENNTITGCPLDAFSVASNSKNILIKGNNISGSYYGIFYGGGIQNVTTVNNIFNNTKAYCVGLAKTAQDSIIINNTFIMTTIPDALNPKNPNYNSNSAIYLEQGNTAHGEATKIGNITIENNKFKFATDVPANQTTYAIEIISAGGPLKLNGNLIVNNNTYANGINKFIFLDSKWNYNDGNINAPQYNINSVITPAQEESTLAKGQTESIQLTGGDGIVLSNQNITIIIKKDDVTISSKNLTTDKFGIINFENDLDEGIYTIVASFAGSVYNSGIYDATTTTFIINSTAPIGKIIPVIASNHLVKYYLNNSQLKATLSVNGKGIANEPIRIFINGVRYDRVTNANGTATMNINLRPGVYNITLVYLGNDNYEGCVGTDVLTVLSTIVSNDLTMKSSKRVPFRAKIYTPEGNYAVGQTVSLNINGIIYNRVVDANGTVTLEIRLLPNTYILTVYQQLAQTTLSQSFDITITND